MKKNDDGATGRKFWYQKQEVTALTEVDQNNRICIRKADGSLATVKAQSLDSPANAMFNCWWNQDNFVIRKLDVVGGSNAEIHIPKKLIPEIIGMMRKTKGTRNSPLWDRKE